MDRVEIRPDRDVFLDYGSGMGRIVLAAATFPFRRVIGIEIAPELTRAAEKNLERVRAKLRCQDVEFVTAEASSYSLPGDMTTLFFHNPFKGPVLSKVLGNIHRSLVEHPRKLTIIYFNPPYFEEYVAGCDWLEKKGEFRFRPSPRCVIYETPSPPSA
jgi:predicted RNA methylase